MTSTWSPYLSVSGVLQHYRWPLIVLLAFSVCLILSIALAQVLLALMTMSVIWKLLRGSKFHQTIVDVPLAIFLVARVLSTIFSSFPETSYRILYAEVPLFLTYIVIREIVFEADSRYVRIVIICLVCGAILASIWGSLNVLSGRIPRATSFTSGYYTLGTYLTAVLAFVLVLGQTRWLFRLRWHWFGTVLILLAGIVLTMNRIHWGIAALLLLAVGIQRERRLLVVALLLAAAAVLLVPTVADRFQQSLHFASNLSDRDWIWKGAIQRMGEHPWLGFGPSTFRDVFPYLDQVADKNIGGWHNDYLQVYMESGLVGLTAFALYLGAALRAILIKIRASLRGSNRRLLASGILAAVGTILLSAVTGRAVLDLLIVMLTGLLLALLAPVNAMVEEGTQIKS